MSTRKSNVLSKILYTLSTLPPSVVQLPNSILRYISVRIRMYTT